MLRQFFSLGNKIESQKIGANEHIISQIHSLEVERDILTKTISRLYDDDSDLNKIQRDRLLLRYQHQLGVIIARIEKLETVSKHPDLGPLGEGLITLMDQKLSHLDQRLYELTSRIQISEEEKQNTTKKESKIIQKSGKSSNILESDHNGKPIFEKPITDFVERPNEVSNKKFEITTLTSHSKMDPIKQTKYDQMLSQLDSDVITPSKKIPQSNIKPKEEISHEENKPETIPPKITTSPKLPIQLPEESEIDDDDDIEQIKSNIMKTLSKIEQAEVD
jgi:uncharacterized protein (UPF0335 family)